MESTLYIDIQGREGVVRYGKKSRKVQFGNKPFVLAISKVVGRLSDIKSIAVTMNPPTLTGGVSLVFRFARNFSIPRWPDSHRLLGGGMKEMTFSGTRQVIATVNTICWALKIKVNGKKQMSAQYDREPNITMPLSHH